MEAIIRQDWKTGLYRVFDSSFYDDGRRFATLLDALKYAKSRDYKFVDVPSGGSISIGIDIAIKNHS